MSLPYGRCPIDSEMYDFRGTAMHHAFNWTQQSRRLGIGLVNDPYEIQTIVNVIGRQRTPYSAVL